MPPDPALSISRWQGRSARNAHSAGSRSGRSTSTHRNRVYATASLLPRGRVRGVTPTNASSRGWPSNRGAGELAGDDPPGVLQQALEPSGGSGGAAGQEVLAPRAAVDLDLARPAAGYPG